MKRFCLLTLLVVLGLAQSADANEWLRPTNQPYRGVQVTNQPMLTATTAAMQSPTASSHLASPWQGTSWYTFDRACGRDLWGGYCQEERRTGCSRVPRCNTCGSRWNLSCGCNRLRNLVTWPIDWSHSHWNHGHGCGCGHHQGYHGHPVIESQEPLAPPMPEADEPVPTEARTMEGWDLLPASFRLLRLPLGK